MYRWCAYCQTHLGEVVPFDDYTISHGICDRCVPKVKRNEIDVEAAKQQAEVFKLFWSAGLSADVGRIPELYDLAISNQIEEIDFLFSIIAPQLWHIGNLFSSGKASVYDEHRFSSFVETMLSWMNIQNKTKLDMPDAGGVLFVCADGNYHALGIRLIERALRAFGVPTLAVFPSLPPGEILKLVHKFAPSVLGISISQSSQFSQVIDLHSLLHSPALEEKNTPPKFIIGGQGWQFVPKELGHYSEIVWDLKNYRKMITEVRKVYEEHHNLISTAA